VDGIRTHNWVGPPGPVAEGLRIGLLGGSFNPAHEGHLHASKLALKQLALDYVWWLVSPQNPLKDTGEMARFETRLQSARGFTRHPRIVVTDIEQRLGTRFTVDTLRGLKRRFPHLHFVWLMGSDNLLQLPRWRNWQQIFALMPIAVIARPASALAARSAKAAGTFRSAYVPPSHHFPVMNPPAWTMLDAKRNPASATSLRAAGGLAEPARLW
jgi:nicotinate-nucleotide adenylyltransferase